MLIELQIKITIWTIVPLAGGGFNIVEEVKRQGEKEENHPSHLQQIDLGLALTDSRSRNKISNPLASNLIKELDHRNTVQIV